MDKLKILFFDLDGTLLRSDRSVSNYTKDILKIAKDKGYLLGVSTGRPYYTVKDLLGKYGILELISIYVCLNGMWVVDENKHQEEINDLFEGTWIKEIINRAKPYKLEGTFVVYDENYLYKSSDHDKGLMLLWDGLFKKENIITNKDLKSLYDQKVWKLIYRHPKPIDEQLKETLLTLLDDKYKGFVTTAHTFEIINRKVSKAKGINKILTMNNLDKTSACMFGDGGNDIDAMEACAISVAMENASQECKDVSTYITSSNDDDGVAKWIKDNLL